MKPMEAYDVIFRCLTELNHIRKEFYPQVKGFDKREIEANIMMFEAFRRMEEDDNGRKK